MTSNRGLNRRLGRSLLLQALYITLAVVVGIFVAARLVEDVLIETALEGEASYFWERYDANPAAELPDTRNMTAYLDGPATLPAHLRTLEPGLHDMSVPRDLLVLVEDRDGHRLYLEFEVGQVDQLVMLFGLVPLTLALLVIYLSTWGAYRVSRRAVSPIVSLAHRVEQLDPGEWQPGHFELASDDTEDAEISVLRQALQDLVRRVTEFTARERRFTRDASHELRTPLTVIRMAADRLLKTLPEDSRDREHAQRIKGNADDMLRLTDTFLLLARNADQGLDREWVSVNEITTAELERLRIVHPDKPIASRLLEQGQLSVLAPAKVVEAVIGNLVRNAFAYTDEGEVEITIADGQVIVQDTGIGMDAEELQRIFDAFYSRGRQRGGFGVGLTIVKRLVERFEWSVDYDSTPGKGTTVTLRFPDARFEASD
ncbi:HAMP domain-containing histidine kinase [Marinihelvus fidelis]|uniref:histidine kinase n=1 Tax=Marinihelvus fidelis TaxID=2613842 RepID=A0A5N0TGL7_9GAMM|nr:HAMP domain-containing sensor histidine kinase [Marinihelvus fidelis]KAA9134200.1 HAMP domain-containing histidine kinase [Marinihelvus fidelis]